MIDARAMADRAPIGQSRRLENEGPALARPPGELRGEA